MLRHRPHGGFYALARNAFGARAPAAALARRSRQVARRPADAARCPRSGRRHPDLPERVVDRLEIVEIDEWDDSSCC